MEQEVNLQQLNEQRIRKFERKLLANGFKKKWLDDDSAYFFKKKFKFPIFGKVECTVEPDTAYMYFLVETSEEDLTKRFYVRKWKHCKERLIEFNLI